MDDLTIHIDELVVDGQPMPGMLADLLRDQLGEPIDASMSRSIAASIEEAVQSAHPVQYDAAEPAARHD